MKDIIKYIQSTFNYNFNIDTKNSSVDSFLTLLDKPLYKIFVTPIDIPGYQDRLERYSKMLQRAVDEWSDVLDNKIRFKVVFDLQGADIKLYWIRSKRIYAARQNWDGNSILPMPVLNIGIVDMYGNEYSED